MREGEKDRGGESDRGIYYSERDRGRKGQRHRRERKA